MLHNVCMSLIVAQIMPNKLEISGDIRLTKDLPGNIKKYSDYFSGCLKIIILSKNLTIAYAGTQLYAEGLIRMVNPDDNPREILEMLREHTDSSSVGKIAKCYEFIVGSTNPEDRFLARVNSGKIDIESSRGQFWIGDKNAFE